MWHHFDPTFELTADLPFGTVRVINDALEIADSKASASDVFGLSDQWPGPDPAFKRCKHRPGNHMPAQLGRT